jgi:hypothetical protein
MSVHHHDHDSVIILIPTHSQEPIEVAVASNAWHVCASTPPIPEAVITISTTEDK